MHEIFPCKNISVKFPAIGDGLRVSLTYFSALAQSLHNLKSVRPIDTAVVATATAAANGETRSMTKSDRDRVGD